MRLQARGGLRPLVPRRLGSPPASFMVNKSRHTHENKGDRNVLARDTSTPLTQYYLYTTWQAPSVPRLYQSSVERACREPESEAGTLGEVPALVGNKTRDGHGVLRTACRVYGPATVSLRRYSHLPGRRARGRPTWSPSDVCPGARPAGARVRAPHAPAPEEEAGAGRFLEGEGSFPPRTRGRPLGPGNVGDPHRHPYRPSPSDQDAGT